MPVLIPHENPTWKFVILSNKTFDSIAKEYGCSDGLCEIAMAEPEEGPWMTVSHTDALFTSLRCKFIMISCTLDPANSGPSKWHHLLSSKQARAGTKLLPRCHQNTLQKLLLLASSNMMGTTRQTHLTAQTARLLTECVECRKTRVVYGRRQLSENYILLCYCHSLTTLVVAHDTAESFTAWRRRS